MTETGMNRFTDQVVVVTGGANGIGRACCTRFGAEGAAIVVADRDVTAAAETVALVEEVGARAVAVELDAASRRDNETMAATAIERFGRIDHLVTAAGISHASYVSGDPENEVKWIAGRAAYAEQPHLEVFDYDIDEFRQVIEVNLIGTFLAAQACGVRMNDGGGGSIVTIASIAAKHPDAGPIAYTASKSAVWMLTKKLSRMLASANIRVNSIGPGFIETSMTQVFDLVPENRREQMLSAIPLGRRGEPADIAAAAAFLCSEDAAYFTGEILHPAGGYFTS